ncbi:MAG: hypothetical protein M3619_13210 [Myxococcota bacterium]|nr:hypothetical protein [Myxococcota bacterium]
MSRPRPILQRLGLVALVGAVATICLSSSVLAGAVALLTVVLVLIDVIALSRRAIEDVPHLPGSTIDVTPERLIVDLSRRP